MILQPGGLTTYVQLSAPRAIVASVAKQRLSAIL